MIDWEKDLTFSAERHPDLDGVRVRASLHLHSQQIALVRDCPPALDHARQFNINTIWQKLYGDVYSNALQLVEFAMKGETPLASKEAVEKFLATLRPPQVKPQQADPADAPTA